MLAFLDENHGGLSHTRPIQPNPDPRQGDDLGFSPGATMMPSCSGACGPRLRHAPYRGRVGGEPARLLIAGPPLVLVFAYLVIPGVADAGGDIANAYTLTAVVSASALAVAIAVRRPRPSWPWLLIIAVEILWILGDVVYTVIGTPSVSIADALYVPGLSGVGGGHDGLRPPADQAA